MQHDHNFSRHVVRQDVYTGHDMFAARCHKYSEPVAEDDNVVSCPSGVKATETRETLHHATASPSSLDEHESLSLSTAMSTWPWTWVNLVRSKTFATKSPKRGKNTRRRVTHFEHGAMTLRQTSPSEVYRPWRCFQ